MKRLLLAIALLWPLSALAQDIPQNSVPYSGGPGTSGWLSVGPCTGGRVLGWTSAAVAPSCIVAGGGGGAGVSSLNSITGDINLIGGTSITVTPSGQNITISSSAPTNPCTVLSLTGDVTSSNSCVTTLATVNSNVGTFGSATQVPTITVNAKGLITAVSSTTIALPFSSLTGSLACGQMPALTGDVTSSAGLCGTTIGNNVVTNAKLAQATAATIKGNPASTTQNVQDFTIQGLPNKPTPDTANDRIMIFDASTATLKQCTIGQCAPGAGGIAVGSTPITGGTTGSYVYDNAGIIGERTPTQVTANLNLFTSTLQGLVPASGGGTVNFLRADGTWQSVATAAITSVNAMTGPAITIAAGAGISVSNATNTVTVTNIGTTGSPLTINIVRITATGTSTYTPSAGLAYAVFECVGAGASGYGASVGGANAAAGGGGGGSGAYVRSVRSASAIGASVSVTVGIGGVASSGSGNPGGNTNAGPGASICSAGGGVPALGYPGGAGGTANIGDFGSNGGPGGSGGTSVTTGEFTPAGAGGSSVYGGGGVGPGSTVTGSYPGNPGAAWGSGGSGGFASGINTANSGAGSNGVIVITEYIGGLFNGITSINAQTGPAITLSAGAGLAVTNPTAGEVRYSGTLFGSAAQGIVPASGGGATNFLRADGTWAAPAATPGTTTNVQPQGRLTLTSGVPVMISSVSGAVTVFYTSYVGRLVPVYDGTNMTMQALCAANTAGVCEVAVALGSNWLANTNYDWFFGNNAGSFVLCTGPAWTSNTARGTGASTTELQQFNGLWTNKNSITCRTGNASTFTCAANQCTYLGSMRTVAAGQTQYVFGSVTSGGGAGSFYLWNAYNRITVATNVVDNSAAYTYAASAYRQANGSTGNQVAFIAGLAEDGANAAYATRVQTVPVSSSGASWGLAMDSTTSPFGQTALCFNNASGAVTSCAAASVVNFSPALGLHVIVALEVSDGTNANTFNILQLQNLAVTLRM